MTGFNYRFSIIPAGAITDDRLVEHPRALQVLCLLGRHTDDLGWCRRSQTQMARELKCARSTVQGALDILYETGWVERRLEGRGQTAPDPEKAPFAAHSYRVTIDRENLPAMPAEGVPDTPAPPGGCPTDRQGVPDQPAPLEGISSKPERESARAGEEARSDQRERRETPVRTIAERVHAIAEKFAGSAADDLGKARASFAALTPAERDTAEARAADFSAFNEKQRRRTPLHEYFAERKWTLAPQKPKADPAAAAGQGAMVPPFDRAWWWLFFDAVREAGRARLAASSSPEATALRRHVSAAMARLGWRIDAARREEVEIAGRALVQIGVDHPPFEAWRKALGALGVTLPRPDRAQFIFVPSEYPPPDQGPGQAPLRADDDIHQILGVG